MHKMPNSAIQACALAVLTLALSACKDEAPTAPAQKPRVGVVTLSAEPYTLTDELPGRTTAFRIAEVRPQVGGILHKRLFTEGAQVKAGQQLYQIDEAVYRANLKSAEASLAAARSLAERYRSLVADKAVSQQAYDEAHAAFLAADAALERARIDLRYTKVLAPISGRIGRSAASEGALVSSGQAEALATIQQLDPIYVDLTQSSMDLLRLRREMASGTLQTVGENAAEIELLLEDGSLYPHKGRLEFSEVSVDESTGSVTLRARIPNPEQQLLPGMFVHARVNLARHETALLVPQQGVSRDASGEATAMVIGAGDKVEMRRLKAERTVGNRWLVSEGLQPGDRLITEGLQFVRPGVEVIGSEASNVDAAATAAPAAAQ